MQNRELRTLLITALTATLLAAGGCSDEQNNGGIVDGAAPDMVTDVNSLVFVEVPLESTDVQTLTIINVGEGDLKLDAIKLVEETTDDSGMEFEKGGNWVGAAALATNEELRLSVEYTPGDKQADEGYIELQTNDPKYADGIARIPLETPTLAPRIYSKENVIFRRVPPVTEETRNKFWQLTEVQNIGQAPLEINDLIVTPQGSDFTVSFPQSMDPEADPSTDSDEFDGELAPGESMPIRVYFNPVDDMPSTAEMLLYSNDPAASEYVVNLLGNSGSPCLSLNEEDEINFGEGAIGYANNKTLILENCSATSDLTVSTIEVCTLLDDTTCDSAAPTFELKEESLPGDLPAAEAVLGPEETASFVLTYTPEDLTVTRGELHVASDDPAKSQLVVPVVGKGTDNQCPEAVAEAALTGSARWDSAINTIPLKTVRFRGTNSVDPDGTVNRYEWNVVQRPTGSTARMAPSNDVAEPTLFLDLAGEYVIELTAYDDRGTESCETSLVTINATPDEAIHVQLVWDTPADADQTDLNGTDIDLHFLHPNGIWDLPPYDVYWQNTTADWGTAFDPSDDPSLDIDDTDGAGPENINLDGPENGLTYQIGVYYYADKGFGPSYATVRVYINGQQEYEKEKLLSESDMFWNVGSIAWPTSQVNVNGTTRMYFP
jgi:hypothetical protein